MNTQTKPSELEVAASNVIGDWDTRTNPRVTPGLIEGLRSALKNHKPAPLPDAVVELIEHCDTTPSSRIGEEYSDGLVRWITDAKYLNSRAKAHLPQKHRCVRAGCDGVPALSNILDPMGAAHYHVRCNVCGLKSAASVADKDPKQFAWRNWYQNDSGVFEGDVQ